MHICLVDVIVSLSNPNSIRDVSITPLYFDCQNLSPFRIKGLSERWDLLSVFFEKTWVEFVTRGNLVRLMYERGEER